MDKAVKITRPLERGDHIYWQYTPPGGYGYTWTVPAVFLRYGRNGWARVEVQSASGKWEERNVKLARLVRVEESGEGA